jgi:hypothetical protein
MKQKNKKVKKQIKELENSIEKQEAEKKFNEFIQMCIQHRETAEGYICAAIRNGKTRRQAIAELNSMGVYMSKLKNY